GPARRLRGDPLDGPDGELGLVDVDVVRALLRHGQRAVAGQAQPLPRPPRPAPAQAPQVGSAARHSWLCASTSTGMSPAEATGPPGVPSRSVFSPVAIAGICGRSSPAGPRRPP